jgi:predicted DNA-binding transcriptional regulator YafY
LPEKLASYSSYGEKLISLFAKLLFSQESHSLTDLARMLKCSKQTVLRLVDDIRRAYGVEIEESVKERRKFFRLKKRTATPVLSLSSNEVTVLKMCKAFTEHLLGADLLKDAVKAIDKNRVLLTGGHCVSDEYFGVLPFGSIDYTQHQETLRTLIRAMEGKTVCKVTYRAAYDGHNKTFFIKPLKLFSHKDCLYLSTKRARYPGRKYQKSDYDPLLAIHRIVGLDLTDRQFEYPKNCRFEKRFNSDFGIIKDTPFEAEIELKGWAAAYVPERIWGRDQKISKKPNGTTLIRFKTSSEVELLSWVLSFRGYCRLKKPKRLFKELKRIAHTISAQHLPNGSVAENFTV